MKEHSAPGISSACYSWSGHKILLRGLYRKWRRGRDQLTGGGRSLLPMWILRRETPLFLAICLVLSGLLLPINHPPAAEAPNSSDPPPPGYTLAETVTCEDIRNHAPWNPAVVFSLQAGKVVCYTAFDPVADKTFIYHNWFHRDRLSARIKLSLHPPRWSTYSSISLREDDKGPWRVEVTTRDGAVLKVLRFSIVD